MDQALIKRVQAPSWLLRSPRRLQLIVFLLVCAVSLLGVFGIETADSRRRHATLERNAADVAANLRQLDGEHGIYLRADAALFAMQKIVTAKQFARLQTDLDFGRHRQGSLGVGWAPRVPASHLIQDERQLRAQTSPAFTIHDARGIPRGNGGADAFPVVYLQPEPAAGDGILGFDMASDPARRAAMTLAEITDSQVATGRLQLMRDAGRPPIAGFLIYMPVFAPNGSGHRQLLGFVYSSFHAADLLDLATLRAGEHGTGVAIYDAQISPDRLLARKGDYAGGGSELVQRVTFAGRPWLLVVSEPRALALSRLSQISFLSGLVVAVLLVALIRITYQRLDEQRQVLEWRASEAGIRNSLTRELNHRVKNTLATVLSIVTLTRRRASDLDSYVESLSGRIRALSATHDLLTTNDWSNVDLRQIVTAELAPYIGSNEDHIVLRGPDIRLAPNDALTLGLAIHELATNAAKYGALSILRGRIDVSWHKVEDDLVEIRWQEIDGPAVTEPTKRGFGRELIEKILAHELQAPVSLQFDAEGLKCVFRVPLRKPTPFILRTKPK